MSTHNICFRGEIQKISTLFGLKKRALSGAMKHQAKFVADDTLIMPPTLKKLEGHIAFGSFVSPFNTPPIEIGS